jgi:hypothetical protein
LIPVDQGRSWVTFYFKQKFDLKEGSLGSIFSITGIIATLSVLIASSLSKRIGNVKVRSQEAGKTSGLTNPDHGLYASTVVNFSSFDPYPRDFEWGSCLPHSTGMHAEYGCGPSVCLSGRNHLAAGANSRHGHDQLGKDVLPKLGTSDYWVVEYTSTFLGCICCCRVLEGIV